MVEHAGRLSSNSEDIAKRFRQGGRLIAFGEGKARADAQHIAVEFIHPVIVGKGALPAFSLESGMSFREVAGAEAEAFLARQLILFGRSEDVAIGISHGYPSMSLLQGLEAAKKKGLLTIILAGGEMDADLLKPLVDHTVLVDAHDPQITQETYVTVYHLLWELVNVFLEHPQNFQSQSMSRPTLPNLTDMKLREPSSDIRG